MRRRSAGLNAATFGLFISGVDRLAHGQAASIIAVELIGALILTADRLSDRYSPAVLGGIRLIGIAAGLVLMATLPSHPSDLAVVWRTAVCRFSFFNSPNNRAMISAAPAHRSSGASGMVATARLLGQTTGGSPGGTLLRDAACAWRARSLVCRRGIRRNRRIGQFSGPRHLRRSARRSNAGCTRRRRKAPTSGPRSIVRIAIEPDLVFRADGR